MGSSLAPILANWFFSDLETESFHKHQEPKMYCRYVDDILCVFHNDKQGKEFKGRLKNLHKTMIFTMEISTSNQLPFLDINLKKYYSFLRETLKYECHDGMSRATIVDEKLN